MKIAYEILALEVDKLYSEKISSNDVKAIDDHLAYIETFIESCGWEVDEYMREYTHRGLKEYLTPDNKEQN